MTSYPINQAAILKNLGITHLNSMQEAMLKAPQSSTNILLQAPTGSGKTVGYLLRILSKLEVKEGVQTLILAPTRELVLQIEAVLKQMKLPLKVNACYGGHLFSIERKNFSVPPTILVGTPGRIKDHLERGTFNPEMISQLVLDEFDKSLEMGFSTQMEYIIKQLYRVSDRILVSATKAIDIPYYVDFDHPLVIEAKEEAVPSLEIKKLVVPKKEKLEGLLQLAYHLQDDQNAIVFANHRDACDRISEFLQQKGIPFSLFHGGLEQEVRESQLVKFRNGSTHLLIATDIAARGIDIPALDYVIHFQIPPQENTFIHRNGRTARMKASGTSVLLLSEQDFTPKYLDEEPEPLTLDERETLAVPPFVTLHINKGKKDKVNKIDIVGFLLQFDEMAKEDIGLVEVKDYFSYVAIQREKYQSVLNAAQHQKIKRKSIKMSLAK